MITWSRSVRGMIYQLRGNYGRTRTLYTYTELSRMSAHVWGIRPHGVSLSLRGQLLIAACSVCTEYHLPVHYSKNNNLSSKKCESGYVLLLCTLKDSVIINKTDAVHAVVRLLAEFCTYLYRNYFHNRKDVSYLLRFDIQMITNNFKIHTTYYLYH